MPVKINKWIENKGCVGIQKEKIYANDRLSVSFMPQMSLQPQPWKETDINTTNCFFLQLRLANIDMLLWLSKLSSSIYWRCN